MNLKSLPTVFIVAMMLPFSIASAQPDESHVLTFKKHKGPVYALALNPDGTRIATSAEDKLIYLWDVSTGEIQKTYEGHLHPAKYLEFSSDGRYLISAAATEIRIWDLTNDTWRDYKKHVTHVYNVTFNMYA